MASAPLELPSGVHQPVIVDATLPARAAHPRLGALKRAILGWDVRLGRHVRLQHAAYMRDPFLSGGQGPYSRADWSAAREAGYEGAGLSAPHLTPDERFLQRAFGHECRKVDSALRLVPWLRQSATASVLEVGCGEMITSWVLASQLPNVRYVATDFDPLVVERARRVSLLDGIEKHVADIDELPASLLRGRALVVAWDVFYAFDDDRFCRVLDRLREAGSTLIMCTSQLIGPLRAASFALKSRLHDYASLSRDGVLRAHGVKCSVGHYADLASRHGLTCELLEGAPAVTNSGDAYAFVRFNRAA